MMIDREQRLWGEVRSAVHEKPCLDRLVSALDRWPRSLDEDLALLHYLDEHDQLWKWSADQVPHFGLVEAWMRGRLWALLNAAPSDEASRHLDFSPVVEHRATINVYWRYDHVTDIAPCYNLLHSSSASASATGNLRFVPRGASYEDVSELLIHEQQLNGPPPGGMDDWFEVDVEFQRICLSDVPFGVDESDVCVSMRDMWLWLGCEHCQPHGWLLRFELLWQLQQRSSHINVHAPWFGCSTDHPDDHAQMFDDAWSLYRSIRELCLVPSCR